MDNLEDTFSDLASFSLANSVNETVGNTIIFDNHFFIYIGIGLLVIVIVFFLYKSYLSKRKVRFSDENDVVNNYCFNDVCGV